MRAGTGTGGLRAACAAVLAACACAAPEPRDPGEVELETRFLTAPVPVLVDMTARRCAPCRRQAPNRQP